MSTAVEEPQYTNTTIVGGVAEDQPDVDQIARMSATRYLFTPWFPLYVGDRVTGMIVAYDEEGQVKKYEDIERGKRVMKTLLVTRQFIQPCALNIINNVTRRVPLNKHDKAPGHGFAESFSYGSMGDSTLFKNGPFDHHEGSKTPAMVPPGAPMRSETKYAALIAREIADTFEEYGCVELPLAGLEESVAGDFFRIVLPKVLMKEDEQLPGVFVPHLPTVLKYLRSTSPKNITEFVKQKANRDICMELLRVLLASCQTGQSIGRSLYINSKKLVEQHRGGHPGLSGYGRRDMMAMLAIGQAIPTEMAGANTEQLGFAEAASRMADAATAMASGAGGKGSKDAGLQKRMEAIEAENAELREAVQKLLKRDVVPASE